MTTLEQEFIRLHGIHRVLHEALPVVVKCPDIVEVWAENAHRDSWEARYGHRNGSTVYCGGPKENFIEYFNNVVGSDPLRRATSYPGAVHFWREAVLEDWPRAQSELRAALGTGNSVVWVTEGGSEIATSTESAADCVAHRVDRTALARGVWLPREFLAFGDEPAPVPFEQDVLSNGWVCDACGKPGRCIEGAVRVIAGLHYASGPGCGKLSNESFIALARFARLRPTHRPDTGRPRYVTRYDTEKGEVVFVDGVRQPAPADNWSPADSAGILQHAASVRAREREATRSANVATLLEEMKRPVASVRSSLKRKP